MDRTILYIILAILWFAYNIYTSIQKRQVSKKKNVPEQRPLFEKQSQRSKKPGHLGRKVQSEVKPRYTSLEVLVDETASNYERNPQAVYQQSTLNAPEMEIKQNGNLLNTNQEADELQLGEIDLKKAIIYSEILNKPKYRD